jgi:hypothetical protein
MIRGARVGRYLLVCFRVDWFPRAHRRHSFVGVEGCFQLEGMCFALGIVLHCMPNYFHACIYLSGARQARVRAQN